MHLKVKHALVHDIDLDLVLPNYFICLFRLHFDLSVDLFLGELLLERDTFAFLHFAELATHLMHLAEFELLDVLLQDPLDFLDEPELAKVVVEV